MVYSLRTVLEYARDPAEPVSGGRSRTNMRTGRPRFDEPGTHNLRAYQRGCRCDTCREHNRRASWALRRSKAIIKTPLQLLKESWAKGPQ